MTNGRFITLEGGEGVGKTSNLQFIKAFLEQNGRSVTLTREPGGTAVGEKIRGILLGDAMINPESELLLVFAARAQHLEEVIRPALVRGDWVVSDRFTDASYAYQGGGRRVDTPYIELLETAVQRGLVPDLTLLLDAPVEVGLARARKRGPSDRFESEAVEFFQRVRNAYLQRAERFPGRLKTIDAARPLIEVQRDIAEHLQMLLNS